MIIQSKWIVHTRQPKKYGRYWYISIYKYHNDLNKPKLIVDLGA